ncbi:YraN family protein [Neisseria sp. Ec49-e6-T10]|uniref:YraN family protein n=1 Tax=Neisseria sp. Ec49-e6-T10 TaxID=3140744 RepID=UPI003EBA0906
MKLNHPTGQQTEDAALAYLKKKGLQLIERNWHCAFGEIDLVMRQGDIYVFVEVKYRKNNQFGGSMYSISDAKCAKLTKTIELYLQTKRIQAPCRVDAWLLQGQNEPVWLQNILG